MTELTKEMLLTAADAADNWPPNHGMDWVLYPAYENPLGDPPTHHYLLSAALR